MQRRYTSYFCDKSSSFAQSCLTLWDLMDCSTPGFPVDHQILELGQTYVLRVGDAIQPSHPLSSPSPTTFNLSQHRVFSNESVLPNRWPNYWSFSFSTSPANEYSELISLRIDWFYLFAVQGTLKTHSSHIYSVSYLFAFSYSSWGSLGKNTEVVCHSIL